MIAFLGFTFIPFTEVYLIYSVVLISDVQQSDSRRHIYIYFSILFFVFIFLLKDNCFTEFCCFLSNLSMSQP